MANCNYVENLKGVVSDYFKNVGVIVANKEQAMKDMKGDYLKAELNRLDNLGYAEWNATSAKMKAIYDARCDKYAQQKHVQLSGATLPDDIKLLSSPVTLTNQELQTLADRHADNYIMQRAVKEYGEKQNIHVDTAPTPDDKIKDAGDLYNHFKNYTTFGTSEGDAAQYKKNQHGFNVETSDDACYREFDATLAD